MKKIFILVSILMISACTPAVESKGNENETCLDGWFMQFRKSDLQFK